MQAQIIFQVHTTRIVSGFRAPTDAELVGKSMYVIENHYDSTMQPALWENYLHQYQWYCFHQAQQQYCYILTQHTIVCDLQLVCKHSKGLWFKLTDINRERNGTLLILIQERGQQQTLQLPLHNFTQRSVCMLHNKMVIFIRVIKLLVQGK
jgi:hypothetical protein